MVHECNSFQFVHAALSDNCGNRCGEMDRIAATLRANSQLLLRYESYESQHRDAKTFQYYEQSYLELHRRSCPRHKHDKGFQSAR